ncbi:hypothetical protein [Vagococcus fluvialis]|uniref:hypothetical protein n=1 Tax=Vagococcus fluvialis TaxID=2738 RepID=UPI001D0B7EA3|nr:hypothetical protein [Vagococcus fluvialis]UDM70152.1 hypothetical protein K5L00_08360 [Vagococcus fluvialis]UDM77571.1 hypothetical protein K5K98_03905 [Vagococcus fluvialis]UDM81841.1 hypothetical protein K5K96_10840 [Vagococcus fluvialis]
MDVIKIEWERLPGIGVKEVYSIDDVVKAEIIFDYEKEKNFYVEGDLVNLMDLTDDFALARYVDGKSKDAKKLYEKQDW